MKSGAERKLGMDVKDQTRRREAQDARLGQVDGGAVLGKQQSENEILCSNLCTLLTGSLGYKK